MTGIKFLRVFNLAIFSILFLMGIVVFFAFYDKLDGYLEFSGMVVKILIPLVIAGAAGSPAKHFFENQKVKYENGK